MKEEFRIEEGLCGEAPISGHRTRFLERLEKEEKKSKIKWMPWLSGAAAVAAVGIWAIVSILFTDSAEKIVQEDEEKFNPISAMTERNAELEGIFTQHIQPKIPSILEKSPELKNQVELLDRLDREYVKLKTLFIKTQGNESVTKEMIKNHKLRLQIMEQMLNQLELMKSIKSKKNEIKSA